MSKIVQWKRGNTSSISSYTGPIGEITVNTDDYTLMVHDGVTAGGHKAGNADNRFAANAMTIGPNNDLWIYRGSTYMVITSMANNSLDQANYGVRVSANNRYSMFMAPNGGVSWGTAVVYPGFDYTFNGEIRANAVWVNPNNSSGFGFAVPGGGTGLYHAAPYGQTTYLALSHNSIPAFKVYDDQSVDIVGDLRVLSTTSSESATQGGMTVHGGIGVSGNVHLLANAQLHIGPEIVSTSFPNTQIQMDANINSYNQLVVQNINKGTQASGDIVVTADAGTDTTSYIDFGMLNSGFDRTNPVNSLGTSAYPLDGYLYVQGNISANTGGNLVIGSTSSNTTVRIIAGGINSQNIAATFSNGYATFGNVIVSNRAPATSSSVGQQGQITWDGNYVYVCVATNTWKRANLATW